jgi:hypothetical protein
MKKQWYLLTTTLALSSIFYVILHHPIIAAGQPILHKQHNPNGLYHSASVTPYYWDKKGRTWFLLGKEKRTKGTFWYNFGGARDNSDCNSLHTAQREGKEETAMQIQFSSKPRVQVKPFYLYAKNPLHVSIKAPFRPHSVAYFLPVTCKINPKKMKYAAKRHRHVEKYDWQWVLAEDLIQAVQNRSQLPGLNAPIYPIYAQTLRNPYVLQHVQKIIATGIQQARS